MSKLRDDCELTECRQRDLQDAQAADGHGQFVTLSIRYSVGLLFLKRKFLETAIYF